MNIPAPVTPRLRFVTAVSCLDTMEDYLLASPDFANQDPRLHLVLGAANAADAFNSVADQLTDTDWLVWVHQDVFLPAGWISLFCQSLVSAQQQWPDLAVVGVYGTTPDHTHAGEVIDRGQHLQGRTALPTLAHGLDELLVAAKLSSDLRMDPVLGWDFYASDLALQASTLGLQAAVIHAPCEHWSKTPRRGISKTLADRFYRAGNAFLTKWRDLVMHKGRLSTPCIEMSRESDLKEALDMLGVMEEGQSEQPLPPPRRNLDETLATALPSNEDLPSIRLEGCWLSSQQLISTTPALDSQRLNQVYRSFGISRVWHLAATTPRGLLDSAGRAFSGAWLLLFTANSPGFLASMPEGTDILALNYSDIIDRSMTLETPRAGPSLYRVLGAPISTPACALTNSATGGPDHSLDGEVPIEPYDYWLVKPSDWPESEWQSFFFKLATLDPRGTGSI